MSFDFELVALLDGSHASSDSLSDKLNLFSVGSKSSSSDLIIARCSLLNFDVDFGESADFESIEDVL